MTIAVTEAPLVHRFFRFSAKLAGLTSGLLLGQGSVFFVQTWLVAKGDVTLVGSFGFGIAFLSLVQWTTDWGGLILVASRVALGEDELRVVWAANIARAVVAAPIMVVVAIAAEFYAPTDPFASGMLIGGLSLAPVWAFNLSGYLDGRGKNALGGALVGAPWVTAGIALVIVSEFFETTFSGGVIVGGAYALGCIICVVFQYAIARTVTRIGWPRTTTWHDIKTFVQQGAIYIAGEFPLQLYGRLLILIVSIYLDNATAGIFIYLRQIYSGVAQILVLIKRIEFPQLATAALDRPLRLGRVLRNQYINLGASLCVFAGSLVIFHLREHLAPQFQEIAWYFGFACASLPMWALDVSFSQILLLRQQLRIYTGVILTTLILKALVTIEFAQTFGLVLILCSDFVAHFVNAIIFAHLAFQKQK